MALYRKDDTYNEILPSDMIWQELDSEGLARMIGRLMDALYDNGALTDEDVIEIIPGASRHFTSGPDLPPEE